MKNRSITVLFATIIVVAGVQDAGCRTLEAPSSFSKDWKAPEWEKSHRTPDTTWSEIRREKVDASRHFSLRELGEIALSNNPATQQAWESARAAEAKKRQNESALYPAAVVSTDFEKRKIDASQKIYSANRMRLSPAASVNYLLVDFGGRSARVKGATQTLLAANFQFNQAIQDLLRDVGNAYYTLYSAQALVAADKADVDNAKASLDAARTKLDAGLVSKLDVLQAESNYYATLFNLEGAKGSVKTAKANLARILGFSSDTPYGIVAPSKDLRVHVSKKDVTWLIDEALKQRPDIAAGRATLRAKKEAVRAAESDRWPSVQYTGGVTRDYDRYFNTSKRFGGEYDYTIAQVALTWDIFDGFKKLAIKRQAEAEAAREEAKLWETELAASADVWTRYYGYKTALRKLSASKAYFTSSRASYDLAFQGYGAGLKSMLDLLQAQTDLSKARSELIQSRRDLFIALVELAHSLGSLTAESARHAANAIQ